MFPHISMILGALCSFITGIAINAAFGIENMPMKMPMSEMAL